MIVRRAVIIGTSLVTAGLFVMFALMRWESANRVATVLAAVAAVAAVGVAIWAALRTTSQNVHGRLRTVRTGEAVADRSGTVNTGISGVASHGVDAMAKNTGDARGTGDANTGIRLG